MANQVKGGVLEEKVPDSYLPVLRLGLSARHCQSAGRSEELFVHTCQCVWLQSQ